MRTLYSLAAGTTRCRKYSIRVHNSAALGLPTTHCRILHDVDGPVVENGGGQRAVPVPVIACLHFTNAPAMNDSIAAARNDRAARDPA